MRIKQYDEVLLMPQKETLWKAGDQDEFIIDVGSSPKDWETIYDVKPGDIVKILHSDLNKIACLKWHGGFFMCKYGEGIHGKDKLWACPIRQTEFGKHLSSKTN